MAATTSVIVVGAGVVGTAIAYEAAKAGARVTLIDRGPVSELGASRFGFGGVTWSTAKTPATIELSRRGFARYLRMDAELGEPCGFTPAMSLSLLRDEHELDEERRQVEEFRRRGHGARLVDPAELRTLDPGLCFDGWIGATALEQGHLDLQRCARAWVKAAAARGLELREGVEVERIAGGGSSVQTSAGSISADLVFVAAGAWTRPLLRRSGLDLPVFNSHAEFLFTAPTGLVAKYQTSWGSFQRDQGESRSTEGSRIAAWREGRDEELLPPTVEHALVRYPDGHLRIGQVTRFIPALHHEPQPESRDLLLASVRGLLPAVERLPGLRLGSRPVSFTPDHLPIVGPLPGMPHALLVATSTSPTILAPAIGEALAAYAVRGAWDPALDEWRLDRDAIQRYRNLLNNALLLDLWQVDPPRL